jgi:hypothetical protein
MRRDKWTNDGDQQHTPNKRGANEAAPSAQRRPKDRDEPGGAPALEVSSRDRLGGDVLYRHL